MTIGAGVGILLLVIAFDGLSYLLTGTHPLHMRGDDGEHTA